jgi:hypothetical protein
MSRSPAVQPLLKHRSSYLYRVHKWWLENATMAPLSRGHTYPLYSSLAMQTARFITAPMSTICSGFIGGVVYANA